MTDTTPGDDVAAMDQDAGDTVRSENEGRPDLPGVGGGDVDPMDGEETASPGTGDTGSGLGDADDVEPGAGAVEPPD